MAIEKNAIYSWFTHEKWLFSIVMEGNRHAPRHRPPSQASGGAPGPNPGPNPDPDPGPMAPMAPLAPMAPGASAIDFGGPLISTPWMVILWWFYGDFTMISDDLT